MLILAIAVPMIVWTVLATGVPAPLKRVVERRAGAALGQGVTIDGPLRNRADAVGIDVAAHAVRVDNPAWARAPDLLRIALSARTGRCSTCWPVAPGFERSRFRDGAVALERSRDGRTSWPEAERRSAVRHRAGRVPSRDRVRVTYADPGSITDLRLLAGNGGTVFTGTARTADRTFAVAGEVRNAVDGAARLRLAAWGGGDRLGVTATAARPMGLGVARLTVFAAGADTGRLAALAGLKLASVGNYALSARALLRNGAWRFTRVAGRAGHTDLAGSVTVWQQAGRPHLIARLGSRALHVDDMARLLGVRRDVAATADPPRLLPDATFSPAALAALDATVDLTAERVVGLDRTAGPVVLRLAMRRGVLVLSPVRVAMDGGFVSADVLVDARRAPAVARYDIRLSPTPMGRLLPAWGVAPAGTTAMARGRILLTGRGMSVRETLATASGRIALVLPAGRVQVARASASALDLDSLDAAIFGDNGETSTINCGAIAFTVRDGIGTTDPLLIDTAAHVLSGQGSIDLREERLDLRLAAGSKHFSLFGRPSPVTIGGSWRSPVVAREPTPWLRPTTLLGLEFSVPDLRSLFSFVDPGDTQPAACPTN